MFAGQSIDYHLPQITDPDYDEYTVFVSLGNALSFAKYNNGKFTFAPKSTDTNKFSIAIKLVDKNSFPKSSLYKLIVKVDSIISNNATNNASNAGI